MGDIADEHADMFMEMLASKQYPLRLRSTRVKRQVLRYVEILEINEQDFILIKLEDGRILEAPRTRVSVDEYEGVVYVPKEFLG